MNVDDVFCIEVVISVNGDYHLSCSLWDFCTLMLDDEAI
jgi:hypothetical protein